jgi:hypothetical protein
MDNELETLRGVCRMLIMRIIEATALRELIDESVMKETKKVVPDILQGLMIAYNQNKDRFITQDVDPLKISDIGNFQRCVYECPTPELVRLAEVSRFIMEKEINAIINAIINKQS